MEQQFQKLAGYCLIIGSILMVLTMALHPSGGDIEHIIKISKVAITAHSIAIFSLPFVAIGFYGLAQILKTDNHLSLLGLAFVGFGLVAIMLAAALNGLILPMYVLKNQGQTGQNLETLKLIIRYGSTFNAAMDFIFIAGYSIAMLLWSIIILKTAILPRWIGIYGIGLLVVCIIAHISHFNFISVTGFAIYVFGIVSWIVLIGYFMVKPPFKYK
jgi:hypothetical protein